LNTEGSYVVELYAYNQYGCADQTEMTVIVDEEIDLYIPNSFTPDYDGINDVWLFKGSGFNNFVFNTKIFNRWGELMFETNDPDQAWTGNYMDGGNFVPDGLYFYRIQVRDSRYEIGHIFEGHITVVR
jgi:gliding motility-associated-like protein